MRSQEDTAILNANVECYSLLYLPAETSIQVNLKQGHDALDTYAGCANLLAKSVAHFGFKYTILTNDASALRKRQRTLGFEIPIREIDFETNPPTGIPFYEAHFKLDAFRFLASEPKMSRMCLLDLDTVMIAPPAFEDLDWSDEALFVYDQTASRLELYGLDTLSRDMSKLTMNRFTEPRWFGGEFIAGTPASFNKLNIILASILDRYWLNIKALSHIGDEVFVSAAMNSAIRGRKLSIIDVGNCSSMQVPAIGRWWSCRTKFQQTPFSDVARAAILHLPADKPFLSKNSNVDFDENVFLTDYKKYLRRRLWLRQALNMVSFTPRAGKSFVGRIC